MNSHRAEKFPDAVKNFPESGGTGVAAAVEGGLLDSSHARSDTKLPSGWGKDMSGEDKYYYNEETGETSWTAPEGSTKDGSEHPDLQL
jgi:hypothetical protein